MSPARPACLPLVVALFVFAGCGRPANPLEWKVEAETPAEYNNWVAQAASQMPPALQQEFVHAFDEFVIVSGHAGVARSPNDSNDPVCRHLNHRTVRQVVLDGYDCEATRLNNRITLDSELLLHDLNDDHGSDARAIARAEAMAKARQREIAADKKRLAEIAQRVRELSSP